MPDSTEPEEKLRPLFRELLDALRRSRDALLQEQIDNARIVHAAVQSYVTGPPTRDPTELQDTRVVCAGLDRLVQRILADGSPVGAEREPSDHPASPATVPAQPLAAWLEHFHSTMRATHPRAIEMLGLLADGYPVREIARRLALGQRLAERIVLDLRRGWTSPPE
jgi:DNA-binding NarL/FixJ family response regulator